MSSATLSPHFDAYDPELIPNLNGEQLAQHVAGEAMLELDYKQLGESIKAVCLDTEKYQLDKHVPEFIKDNKYVGDFFNFTMFELNGDESPTFYHVYSPYDIISNKSTEYAAVLRDGELLIHTKFTTYMRQRTGVMTALVIQSCGLKNVTDKRILYIGTGKIAQHDLAALKAYFPELKQVSYVNKSGDASAFIQTASSLGVKASIGNLENIDEFDVIICHTNAKSPVLTADMQSKIKPGAIITAFSSEDHSEVAAEYFDSQKACIVIDWDHTLEEANELRASVAAGRVRSDQLVTLRQLFTHGLRDHEKQYTIYRSHGTPMQNLAALQVLLKSKKA